MPEAKANHMRFSYLGDSYDLVKLSLVRALAEFGPWSVEPMFTVRAPLARAEQYANLLGAALVSRNRLTVRTNRKAFFRGAKRIPGALLLDPDTGVAKMARRAERPHYLLIDELADIVVARPSTITLVFDQSAARASDAKRRRALKYKLRQLSNLRVHGTYYFSHAPCLVASAERSVLEAAEGALLQSLHLPKGRLLQGPPPKPTA